MQTNYRKRTRITDKDLRFRVPREIIRDLDIMADINGRSRTAEILDRLVETLRNDKILVGEA